MEIHTDTASMEALTHYLIEVSDTFIPPLDTQVNLLQYAEKIFTHATRLEYFSQQTLIGLCGVYFNDSDSSAYITTISVLPTFQKKGIAQLLLDRLLKICVEKSTISRIELEVAESNSPAIKFYRKNGFQLKEFKGEAHILIKHLHS